MPVVVFSIFFRYFFCLQAEMVAAGEHIKLSSLNRVKVVFSCYLIYLLIINYNHELRNSAY